MFHVNVTRIVDSIAGVGECWQALPDKHKLNAMEILGIVLLFLIFFGVTYIVRLMLTKYTNNAIKRAFEHEMPLPEAINLMNSPLVV